MSKDPKPQLDLGKVRRDGYVLPGEERKNSKDVKKRNKYIFPHYSCGEDKNNVLKLQQGRFRQNPAELWVGAAGAAEQRHVGSLSLNV